MNLLRKNIRELLKEQNVIAIGQCFPFAYEMALKWWKDHIDRTKPRGEGVHPDLDDKDKFKVVHGTVTNKWEAEPKPVVHAWVEMGDMIFDDQTKVTKPNGVPREVYYDMFQPEIRNEYTAEEAVMKCSRTGSPGPWDEELFNTMQQRDAWLNDGLIREREEPDDIMNIVMTDFFESRHFDDTMDAVFKHLAPRLVRHVLEREINEDMAEFTDGAIEGRWEKQHDWAGEDPTPKDSGYPEDSLDYKMGYSWGWANADTWEGNTLPADARKAAVEMQIREFEDEISEEMIIAALEAANKKINPWELLKQAGRAIRGAYDEAGGGSKGFKSAVKKGLPVALSILVGEALDNVIIPMTFFSLTGIPIPPLPVGVGEIINPIVISMVGAEEVQEELTDELGWYEKEYGRASSIPAVSEGLLRQYVKELLTEGIEFRTLDSPLTYNRSGNVKRIALCDTSVKEPNPRRDAYFNEYQEMERYGVSGRRLKKPRKGKLVPGVSDDCVIGFLDYHKKSTNSDGSSYWYIDYMKTRGDKSKTGVASKLIDQFYETVAQPGDHVSFGKMMQPQIGHLKDKMVDKRPEITTIGAKYF